jgi:hypothetical protein
VMVPAAVSVRIILLSLPDPVLSVVVVAVEI